MYSHPSLDPNNQFINSINYQEFNAGSSNTLQEEVPGLLSSSCSDYSESYDNQSREIDNDPELLAKFKSLDIDELDDDKYPSELLTSSNTPQPQFKVEPRRHASDFSLLKIESRPFPRKTQQTINAQRGARNSFSSSKVFGSFGVPPGLASNTTHKQVPASMYMQHPYSSTNLNQFPGPMPIYPIPQYYVCQPQVIPVPMVYGCYNYPQVPHKPEPRRNSSFMKSTNPMIFEPIQNIPPELSESAIALIKYYEKTGDYAKLSGEIFNLAKIQSGSRFLQNELDKGNSGFITFLLKEVFPSLSLG